MIKLYSSIFGLLLLSMLVVKSGRAQEEKQTLNEKKVELNSVLPDKPLRLIEFGPFQKMRLSATYLVSATKVRNAEVIPYYEIANLTKTEVNRDAIYNQVKNGSAAIVVNRERADHIFTSSSGYLNYTDSKAFFASIKKLQYSGQKARIVFATHSKLAKVTGEITVSDIVKNSSVENDAGSIVNTVDGSVKSSGNVSFTDVEHQLDQFLPSVKTIAYNPDGKFIVWEGVDFSQLTREKALR